LIFQGIRFARALHPKVILFENVPGLAAQRHSRIIAKLEAGLASLDYEVSGPHDLDAADYGVPQRRRRFILFASRVDAQVSIPKAVTPPEQRTTVRDAIGSLPPLKAGQAVPSDALHRARNHSALTLRRLSHIPNDGGSRSSLPDELVLPCHRKHDGHPDVLGRMTWDDVAPTLTTGCTDVTKGRFAHPDQDRAISAREAALLQSFPGSYAFVGSATEIARQIGNAVPPCFIKELLPAVRAVL